RQYSPSLDEPFSNHWVAGIAACCIGCVLCAGQASGEGKCGWFNLLDEQSRDGVCSDSAHKGFLFHLRNSSKRFCCVCFVASKAGWHKLESRALSRCNAGIARAGLSGGQCELE